MRRRNVLVSSRTSDVGVLGWRHAMKHGALEGERAREGAVDEERVEMEVEQQPSTIPCRQPSRSTTRSIPTRASHWRSLQRLVVRGAA
jgi:hypothetical protein